MPQIYKTSGFIKEYGFPTKTGDLYSCLVLILMSILSVIPKAISTTCIYWVLWQLMDATQYMNFVISLFAMRGTRIDLLVSRSIFIKMSVE
jgi:uncharacterized protein (DUF983 family)